LFQTTNLFIMKNLSLLLISVVIFLTGIILKLLNVPGAGIFLVLGLAVFIVYSAITYIRHKNPVMKKVLIISSIVLLATLIFAMIKYQYFAEMVIGAVITGLIIFLISLLMGGKRKI
jgi:hypothetical protein